MTLRPSRRALATGAAAMATTALLPRGALAQATPLKIGSLLPRSGFLALIGQACQRGRDLALPILKDMGYSVELMNADFESKPDVARTQAEKLIREGAQCPARRLRIGRDARHRPGRRAAWRPLRHRYRLGALDHRAGLQIRLPQFPDERDARE